MKTVKNENMGKKADKLIVQGAMRPKVFYKTEENYHYKIKLL